MKRRSGPPASWHNGVYLSGDDPGWYADLGSPSASAKEVNVASHGSWSHVLGRAYATSGANMTGTPASRMDPSPIPPPVWNPASGQGMQD